jgi:hypothetical protein
LNVTRLGVRPAAAFGDINDGLYSGGWGDMVDARVRDFAARCEAAAAWREAIADRHEDERSRRSAGALREVADWARTDPSAILVLADELRDVFVEPEARWTDAQEYSFTTFCFEEEETREQWLTRVRSVTD